MEASQHIFRSLRVSFQPLQENFWLLRPQKLSRRAFSRSVIPSNSFSTSSTPPFLTPRLRVRSIAPSLGRPRTTSRGAHSPNESSAPVPSQDQDVASARAKIGPTVDVPSYTIPFTCKPCFHRTTHRISKQGYHKGTVLITCPNCKARHLISDHLRVCHVILLHPVTRELRGAFSHACVSIRSM